jgi:hypothetical protein
MRRSFTLRPASPIAPAYSHAPNHIYVGIEDLSLTAGQRSTLATQLRALGNNAHDQPHHRNHWRIRLDGLAAIYEAEFNAADWTIGATKTRLANLFGVTDSSITHSVQTPTFSTRPSSVVTFAYLSINRLRLVAFGGLDATRQESLDEVRAYIDQNKAAWD